ncbi:MAG: AAA family ATPase [Magnetococcales bacterium]|nr:AAA family ATPase [Magnetococcales bacterium]
MSDGYLQLGKIKFGGPEGQANLDFVSGVNVICGASDTGKSFLAEAIDFMLGGSELREIPERAKYGTIELDLRVSNGENWRLERSTSGGNFRLVDIASKADSTLKKIHSHGKSDNLSGFLLQKLGLLGKRILRSSTKATTQSLSFRNLARLVIVQEGEIQQHGSPFWGGQYTTKISDLATIKLLLTGIDDSSVVSFVDSGPDNTQQIALIDELLSDLASEIEDIGEEWSELTAQLERLEISIQTHHNSLNAAQRQLDDLQEQRRGLFEERRTIQNRLDEINDLLTRFDLLRGHYKVDIERLIAIRESGSMFAHVDAVSCPLCGASPVEQHLEKTCDGDVDAIVLAATAEIEKIKTLQSELADTVADLKTEADELNDSLSCKDVVYGRLNITIKETVAPEISDARATFSELVENRARVQHAVDLYARVEKLESRKLTLQSEEGDSNAKNTVSYGIPESLAHEFSQKISRILKDWNFPGDCHVYYDKQSTDFVIDGKPRGSRGKGLRAITHAAVTIGLLEYCQENELSHPGFVVLDSPLLAYFKPEGDDDLALKGTDLKERFYNYLVHHHGTESQVIIIENQHPPPEVESRLALTVFTGNPNEGRFGLL